MLHPQVKRNSKSMILTIQWYFNGLYTFYRITDNHISKYYSRTIVVGNKYLSWVDLIWFDELLSLTWKEEYNTKHKKILFIHIRNSIAQLYIHFIIIKREYNLFIP